MCDNVESREFAPTYPHVQVFLDGLLMRFAPEATSLASIRFQLETKALEQNRILCVLKVDGAPVNLADSLCNHGPFARVEAETIDVRQMPLQLVQTALQQCAQAAGRLQQAVTRVVINDGPNARQLWWSLACELKHPLVTLSLVPEVAGQRPAGSASVLQLRKWQLQQLALIMKEVDESACSDDTTALSNALERRVFPWLAGLERSLQLLQETLLAQQWAQSSEGTSPSPQSPLPVNGTAAVPFFNTNCPRLGRTLGS
jgi:hypothetical protein